MAPEAALADEVLAACFGRLSLLSQPRIARVSRRWRDAAALAFARRLRWRKKARAARPWPSGSPQKQRAAEQKQRKSSTEGVPLTRDTTGTVSASSTDASSGSKSPKGDPHDA